MKKHYLSFPLLLISIFAFAQQPYYNDVDLTKTGIPLKDELATKIINTHTTFLSYSEAYQIIKTTDEDSNNSSNVLLVYNSQSESKNNTLGGGNTSNPQVWNREHTYPKSLGSPNLGTSGPGSDVHHLRSCNASVNSSRGSLKFIDGSGNYGLNNSGWYPGDLWKGDIARMMMYMYLRYGNQCLPNNVTTGITNSIDSNMINLLLEWNVEDPVSAIEVQRNTILESAQGNRNPFIDNPYLATLIWGGTAAEDIWGVFGGGSSDTQAPSVPMNISVSNETSSTIDLDWTASTDNTVVTGYDIYADGIYNSFSATNSVIINGLTASTTYSFTVLAKDAANNMSAQSSAVNGTTLAGGGSGGPACLTETFGNIPAGQSNYATRTWTGDGGGTWSATFSRTDQTINGPAITVRAGSLTSPVIAAGIGELTVTTQLVFSGSSGNFDLLVNGSSVGSIPYSSTETTTTISNINIEGDVTIVMDKSSPFNTNRVRIDDLTWTCYSALGVDSFKLSDVSIYPNPAFGNTLHINTRKELTITIFDLLGKEVLKDVISVNKNKIDIGNLKSGLFLVKFQSENASIVKKFIKQ